MTALLERATPQPAAHRAPPAAPAPTLPWSIARSLTPPRVSSRTLTFAPLAAILLIQTVVALRLRSSAWGDEGLYAFAGHEEIAHLLHGTDISSFHYGSYFSGAPALYPVLSGFLDGIGGLALVRAFSLVCMLVVTVCAFLLGETLFGRRAGTWGALIFATTSSTLYLSHFATYDALCLALISVAMIIGVRLRGPGSAVVAGLLLALAMGVKYAGALWVPSALVLPVLVQWGERPVRAVGRALLTAAVSAGAVALALALWGGSVLAGITSTTTSRDPLLPISRFGLVHATVQTVGWTLLLIGIGAVVALRRAEGVRVGVRRWLLVALLTGTAVLAPVHQIQIRELAALYKHSDFGLVFAAPLAGLGVHRILTALAARARILAIPVLLAVTVISFSGVRHAGWLFGLNPVNPAVVSAAMAVSATHTGAVNVQVASNEPAAIQYYARFQASQKDWTFGSPAAIKYSAYSEVVLNDVIIGVPKQDIIHRELLAAVRANPRYVLVWSGLVHPGQGDSRWYVWERVPAPATGAAAAAAAP
jgi:4-amino-4-deoxy-L-arabinose transferase-like glycosyltransferase